ncbi:hypothetical protein TWF694_001941 [Orbilia ellipsospora]|uniref:Mitochondrial division protein 1 n=1 Tax=Orbilia ellipsospora TaxID=2528407 RepID=A0AAV9X460_9PEZI
MCLLGNVFEVIHLITNLQNTVDVKSAKSLVEFLRDTRRFIVQNQKLIDDAPLQTYSSCLTFLPESSIIKRLFEVKWVWKSRGDENWSMLLQSFRGHDKWVIALAFSPNGQTIVSSSEDTTIKLWDVIAGEVRYTFKKHLVGINFLAFSPKNAKFIVSASSGGHVMLWDATTGQVFDTFEGYYNSVNAVAFSPGGHTIVFGSQDGIIGLWDATTTKSQVHQTLEGRREKLVPMAFSPDGQTIAFGSADATLNLWDATAQVCYRFDGHSCAITVVVFSPDGHIIASISEDNTLGLWIATRSGSPNFRKFNGHSDSVSSVNSVAFSPVGDMIASCSIDQIRLWNVTAGTAKAHLTIKAEGHGPLTSVTFSPDGQTVASNPGYAIMIWDKNTGKIRHRFKEQFFFSDSIAFSPTGKIIASGCLAAHTIKLWDITTGNICCEISTGASNTGLLLWYNNGYISNGKVSFFSPSIPGLRESSIAIQPPSDFVYIHNQWLIRGEEELLWAPDRYEKVIVSEANGTTIALRDNSGLLAIIKFDFSAPDYTEIFDTN